MGKWKLFPLSGATNSLVNTWASKIPLLKYSRKVKMLEIYMQHTKIWKSHWTQITNAYNFNVPYFSMWTQMHAIMETNTGFFTRKYAVIKIAKKLLLYFLYFFISFVTHDKLIINVWYYKRQSDHYIIICNCPSQWSGISYTRSQTRKSHPNSCTLLFFFITLSFIYTDSLSCKMTILTVLIFLE